MNQDLISHGFLPDVIARDSIVRLKQEVDIYLYAASYPTYTPNLQLNIPSASRLISEDLLRKVKGILGSTNVVLQNIELHYLPPCSSPIPPHQDNFYHCLEGGEGLKVLIPLTNLNANTGGLYFLDCPSSVGVLPHHPSNVNNFSSYISADVFDELDYPASTYAYHLGDASYHILNCFKIFNFSSALAIFSTNLSTSSICCGCSPMPTGFSK